MTYFNEFGQARLGWRTSASGGGGGSTVDTDAQAFITAANITDTTQQSAINTLVTQLKTYGIWTKLKAVYPFVGGTATTHKFNLKDPRDLDAAYRLVFNGGWIHSSTGALPNGTNGYADTFLTPSTVLTSPFIGYYSRTNANTGIDQIDMGSKDSSNRYLWISAWYNGSGYSNILARNSSVGVLLNGGTTTDSRGWYWTNKISTTAKLGKNSTILTSATDTQTPPSIPTTIGKINVDAGAPFYTNRETAFSVIADGMSDTDTTNLYTAVQTFQTTLGRQVGVPIVADSDAQAFLNAAVITNQTQANAINTLVTSLKSANIWTKMKAIYPFVGGTATTHKFNLKDPRDLDAAYRLVFNGGGSHSANGYLGNASNAFADTKLSPFVALTNNNNHLSVYSNLANTDPNGEYSLVAGALNATYTERFDLLISYDNTSSYATNTNSSTQIAYPESNKLGMYMQTRTANNVFKLFKNNSIVGTNTGVNTGQLPNFNLFLGAHNVGGTTRYAYRRIAFASIGDGLTDAEATAFYNAVQAYQTTLGRQI